MESNFSLSPVWVSIEKRRQQLLLSRICEAKLKMYGLWQPISTILAQKLSTVHLDNYLDAWLALDVDNVSFSIYPIFAAALQAILARPLWSR